VKNKGVVAGNCDNGSNSDDRGKMMQRGGYFSLLL